MFFLSEIVFSELGIQVCMWAWLSSLRDSISLVHVREVFSIVYSFVLGLAVRYYVTAKVHMYAR